jgi:hypothetical protein
MRKALASAPSAWKTPARRDPAVWPGGSGAGRRSGRNLPVRGRGRRNRHPSRPPCSVSPSSASSRPWAAASSETPCWAPHPPPPSRTPATSWRPSPAALAILAAPILREVPGSSLITLDAAGLSLFAVAGVQKALSRDIGPFGAVLMGTLTATGGGATRDVLFSHVPMILRTDFYATAAILGCVTILLVRRCGLSSRIACGAGGLVCFVARLVGAFNHWHLPGFR